MNAIAKLGVVTVDEERKKAVIARLEDALERAKAGEVDAVLVLTSFAGGDEVMDAEHCGLSLTEMIGQLERAKFALMRRAYEGD